MSNPFDTYQYLRAWEQRRTARLPRTEDWPTVRLELERISVAAGEAIRHGDSIFNPPPEHGDIGTP